MWDKRDFYEKSYLFLSFFIDQFINKKILLIHYLYILYISKETTKHINFDDNFIPIEQFLILLLEHALNTSLNTCFY